jgi:hypothetical protein
MAVIALQRKRRADSTWSGHVFWAGDSRAYAFSASGAHQLSTDDLRDPGDAMANLHHDSVVSNAMSADTEFRVGYRRVELKAPFLLVCATDGCFGYVPTPMHFEHLVLKALVGARSTRAWSEAVQAEISAVTGDDAAMAVMGVGADLAEFQALLAPRLATLEDDFIGPLDQLRQAVQEAERTLQVARQHEHDQTAALWGRYQPEYERHLRPPVVDDEQHAEVAGPAAEDVRTPVDGDADGVEERPDEVVEQPEADTPTTESSLDRPIEVV